MERCFHRPSAKSISCTMCKRNLDDFKWTGKAILKHFSPYLARTLHHQIYEKVEQFYFTVWSQKVLFFCTRVEMTSYKYMVHSSTLTLGGEISLSSPSLSVPLGWRVWKTGKRRGTTWKCSPWLNQLWASAGKWERLTCGNVKATVWHWSKWTTDKAAWMGLDGIA